MTLWITLALMTGAAVFLLLWPLARHRAAADGGHAVGDADDVAFYTAQLAEIDRDAKAGLIGDAEAELARAEAARRLLRAAPAVSTGTPGGTGRTRLASLLALAAVPLIALPLYLQYGAPALRDRPLAERR
ncbi:MAG: c-type cytochrome biogenesis protein CcmI, partial [Beijerinckiaceae bacterium]